MLVSLKKCGNCSLMAVAGRSYCSICIETRRNVQVRWRQRNPGARTAYYKMYRESRKAVHKEYYREYLLKNPGRAAARNAKRYAGKKKRTPLWADVQKLESFYVLASRLSHETGIEYEVDHVIPLHGLLVSGLHVSENLQVITAAENLQKGNRFLVC